VAAFEQVLTTWLAAQADTPPAVLALDGKTLRGIHGDGVPGVHLVAAYAQGRGTVQAQKGGPARSMSSR
jgi:hypothetical protein